MIGCSPGKWHAIAGRIAILALVAIVLTATRIEIGHAQMKTPVPPLVPGARPVIVQHLEIHSPAVAGNLEGVSADREVIVFLPPDYYKDRERRYPVVYALHGFFIDAEQWTHEIHVPQTLEGAFAKASRPMILVLPDSHTGYGGSMYSSSLTTGNFERFIAHDVVSYVDAHYRTLPYRVSRGLVGHSMGGYGAVRIGMKYPEVFGSLYIMSPCCLSPFAAKQIKPAGERALERLKSPADAANLPWYLLPPLALAAAWSPDPRNPPLYLDLPFENGVLRPGIVAKWTANAPLAFIDQYIGNLRAYRGIAIDVGDQDHLRFDSRKLHDILDSYGIRNSFTIYHGTHTSGVAYRFEDYVMPFFSRHLCFAHCRQLSPSTSD
ncbi:MAG TPA: alpha/beta fold hydrolase [Steroidobacteraceae bacterium]|nr:alpha/beta fold hydrolase [Steroidobacteraceae bacterium]